MFKRLGAMSAAVIGGVALLFTLVVGMAPTSFAAPSVSAQANASPTIHLAHKVTLHESSIDGPAFSSGMDNFEGVHFFTAIAWTGIDPQHRLNVIQSTDDPANGVTHFSNKLTLGETSFVRPAVVQFGGGLGNTALAWVGTDKAHTLNFVWDAYGANVAQHKVTLWGETSNAAPALALFGNNLILAWTGTDANHSLNVLPYNLSTQTFGTKTVQRALSSSAGPNLSVFNVTGGDELVLNWTTSAQALDFATSTDGVHFTPAIALGPRPEFSANAPSSFYHKSDVGERAYMAWTGTDSAHHINIQWTQSFPEWPDPATTKYTLSETAFGGPQIASNDGYLIAWTGTDPAHSLNVAAWDLY
jgi:hypothetical protein